MPLSAGLQYSSRRPAHHKGIGPRGYRPQPTTSATLTCPLQCGPASGTAGGMASAQGQVRGHVQRWLQRRRRQAVSSLRRAALAASNGGAAPRPPGGLWGGPGSGGGARGAGRKREGRALCIYLFHGCQRSQWASPCGASPRVAASDSVGQSAKKRETQGKRQQAIWRGSGRRKGAGSLQLALSGTGHRRSTAAAAGRVAPGERQVVCN